MNEIIPYLWLAVIVLSAIAEFLISKRFWICFIPSGAAAFAMSLFLFPVRLQVAVFTIITFILIILSRNFLKIIKFRQKFENKEDLADLKNLLGKPAIVVQEINNIENMGVVKIRGMEWSARTLDDDVIYETGDIVYVNNIQENNLVCEK